MTTSLISDVFGQDGAYLSESLLSRGYAVVGAAHSSERRNFAEYQFIQHSWGRGGILPDSPAWFPGSAAQ